MGQAKQRGTREDRIKQAAANKWPEQYFGYDRARLENESPFDFPEEGLVCMVQNITLVNQAGLQSETGIEFPLGEWICSTGVHENTVVDGPFKLSNDAFKFAETKVNVVRFVSVPQWGD